MKIGFDGGIKLEFHGAKVTSDGGLLAVSRQNKVDTFPSIIKRRFGAGSGGLITVVEA